MTWQAGKQNRRSEPPESIRPFRNPLAAWGLAEISHRCTCTWVPGFTPDTAIVPLPGDPRGQVKGWHADRWVLKFADRMCPVRAHHL